MQLPMTYWPNHLNEAERAHLAKVDAQLAELKRERNRLANMAKLRRHRAKPRG